MSRTHGFDVNRLSENISEKYRLEFGYFLAFVGLEDQQGFCGPRIPSPVNMRALAVCTCAVHTPHGTVVFHRKYKIIEKKVLRAYKAREQKVETSDLLL